MKEVFKIRVMRLILRKSAFLYWGKKGVLPGREREEEMSYIFIHLKPCIQQFA